MVAFHDRRLSKNSDFNNPAGTFEMTTPGHDEFDQWSATEPSPELASNVHKYFQDQKGTQTWREATKRAKRSADSARRKGRFSNGADYADHYQNALVNVMSVKGRGLADKYGELNHPQHGYGRL